MERAHPAEPTAAVSELQVPLSNFIRETAHVIVQALGLEKEDTIVQGMVRSLSAFLLAKEDQVNENA